MGVRERGFGERMVRQQSLDVTGNVQKGRPTRRNASPADKACRTYDLAGIGVAAARFICAAVVAKGRRADKACRTYNLAGLSGIRKFKRLFFGSRVCKSLQTKYALYGKVQTNSKNASEIDYHAETK